MVTMIFEILILTILSSLIILNQIGIQKIKKRRKAISWIHMRKVMLGINDKSDILDDIFVDKSFLKM